ncbi:metallopeptidase TldD-related protein [Desertimonas flava]|uniref:metallopeptidase TldD-related protein n=1 Tax=Desertimonas flava TaxID=2064846 RepID=UPI000E34A468|nr:metallopeptidase TldD-related protein [Desertimonas flava]
MRRQVAPERIVETVLAAAPGAEVEATVVRDELALTRFANSFIHQNVADESTTTVLRVHVDGRTVTTSTSSATPEDLDGFVASTLEAARTGPRDPGWPGVAPAVTLPDARTLAPLSSPADRAALVRAFVDGAGGLEAAGYCRDRRVTTTFANSAGHHGVNTVAGAACDGIARDGGNDGVARLATFALGDIDGAELGARAAAKARAAAATKVDLEPGRYEVVLEPSATADIIMMLAGLAFNGRSVQQRQSFAEIGGTQFDPSITIVDDPVESGLTFDAEGTPTSRLLLVDGGTTAALTYDRHTAAAVGAASTGHSGAPGATEPVAFNAGIAPGPAADVTDAAAHVHPAAAALVAGIERGILVSDFWYTRVLDPKPLAVTGLTRNGLWLIEDGEVTQALSNLRFTQAYAAALAPGNVTAVGPIAVGEPERWSASHWSAPALRLASWNFTGGAAG